MHKARHPRGSPKHQLYVALFLVGLVVGAYYYVVRSSSPSSSALTLSLPAVLPHLYSDTHITENAKLSDPHFADSVTIEGGGQIASILSAFAPRHTQILPTDTAAEKGTWLWTPVLEITPTYRDTVIAGAKQEGIKAIYLSIDSYLDIFIMPEGSQKSALKKQFDETLEDFVTHAHAAGIAVDAEGGWRNWAEPGHTYKPAAVVAYAIDFNKMNTEKLRGFQYDVEPYLLSEYQSQPRVVLRRFTALVDQSLEWLYGSDLRFAVVVPDFYDTLSAGKFFYGFHRGDTINQLVRLLDRRPGSSIIVMAYRNFAQGHDGAIDISQGELREAQGHTAKIVIASEFGDVPPPYTTYFNTSRARYERQIAAVEKAFASASDFGGISLHYLNAFLALK